MPPPPPPPFLSLVTGWYTFWEAAKACLKVGGCNASPSAAAAPQRHPQVDQGPILQGMRKWKRERQRERKGGKRAGGEREGGALESLGASARGMPDNCPPPPGKLLPRSKSLQEMGCKGGEEQKWGEGSSSHPLPGTPGFPAAALETLCPPTPSSP